MGEAGAAPVGRGSIRDGSPRALSRREISKGCPPLSIHSLASLSNEPCCLAHNVNQRVTNAKGQMPINS
jgi:hypothetical protein